MPLKHGYIPVFHVGVLSFANYCDVRAIIMWVSYRVLHLAHVRSNQLEQKERRVSMASTETASPSDTARTEAEFFEGNITYSIIVLANMISRNTSSKTLSQFSISINEWRVLRMTRAFGPICAADVINTLAMDKTTVSRAITNLHAGKLISLAPNARDRRQTLVDLTPKGRRLHDKIAPLDEKVDKSFEAVLTDEEIQQFHSIMRKLRPSAQKLLVEG